MKNLILFILLSWYGISFAQNSESNGLLELVMVNSLTKKTVVINELNNAKVKLLDNSKLKGNIQVINDSIVTVGDQHVKVDSIQSIKVIRLKDEVYGKKYRNGGLTALGLGVITSTLGYLYITNVNCWDPISITLLGGGLPMTGAGVMVTGAGIAEEHSGYNYRAKDNWTFEIRPYQSSIVYQEE